MKFDRSKAEQPKDFNALPAGKYEVFIEKGEVKTAATGSKFINMMLNVRDDVEAQKKFGGRKLFYRLFFTEKTVGIVHGFLEAIGTPQGKDFGDTPDIYIPAILNYATGKAALANVKTKTYQGNLQNEVSFLGATVVGGGKQDDPFGQDEAAATNDGNIDVTEDDLPF